MDGHPNCLTVTQDHVSDGLATVRAGNDGAQRLVNVRHVREGEKDLFRPLLAGCSQVFFIGVFR